MLLRADGYFDADSHFPLWLSLVALPVEAAEALRSFNVPDNLAAIPEPVNVVLRPAADVGVEVPSVPPRGAAVRLKTELQRKRNLGS